MIILASRNSPSGTFFLCLMFFVFFYDFNSMKTFTFVPIINLILRDMKKIVSTMLIAIVMMAATVSAQTAEQYYKTGKEADDAKDYATAVANYQKAADMGFAKAQYQLGRAYEKGYGVAKSDKTAVKYYQMAAEQGHAKSQYQLGRAYDKGDGVKEDDAKAFQWYSKAAQQGNSKAQYQLGRCYKKGEGCTKDANAAFQWFEKSAAQGNADAQLALGKCYLKGKGVAEDAAKAKDLFLQAVNNPDGGDKIYKDLKKEASEGDADAKKILNMVKK